MPLLEKGVKGAPERISALTGYVYTFFTLFFLPFSIQLHFVPQNLKSYCPPPPRARPHPKYLDRAILVIQVIVCFTIKGSQRQPNFLIK